MPSEAQNKFVETGDNNQSTGKMSGEKLEMPSEAQNNFAYSGQ